MAAETGTGTRGLHFSPRRSSSANGITQFNTTFKTEVLSSANIPSGSENGKVKGAAVPSVPTSAVGATGAMCGGNGGIPGNPGILESATYRI
jgi:hypothetical protein